MLRQCERCGAALPPPSPPDTAFVVCAYCQTANAVPDAMRRDPARVEPTPSASTPARSSGVGLAVAIGIAGVVAAVGAVASLTLLKHEAPSDPTEQAPSDPEGLARVAAALGKLETAGCNVVVTTPRTVSTTYTTALQMKAGGNCVHVLASAPATQSVDVRVQTPLAKTVTARAVSGQVADLEHCPAETGSRTLTVTTTPAGPVSVALVDCAPEREKHRDDPAENGLARVAERLEALRKKGCREVLFAPKTVSDEQSFTATLVHGAGCAVIVAATRSDANSLTAELRTPLGRIASKPDASALVELGYCATTSGPHPLTIRPKTNDYYTVGAVNCPRLPRL